MYRIINTLIHTWLNSFVCFANLANLSNLPSHIVRDDELLEQAFFVQIVDFAQDIHVRRRSIQFMQISHVDLLRIKRLETSF